MTRTRKPWSSEEDSVVDWHWGEERLATTARRVGRTVQAVRMRLISRYESSAVCRGRSTIAEVAESTGYDWHQIERGIRGAGVRPVRTSDAPRGRRWLLTDEQVAEVVAWLGRETAAATERGPTVTEVAEFTGRSRSTAYVWVDRLELCPGQDGALDHLDAVILATVLTDAPSQPPPDGATIRAISSECGVARRTAYHHANILGVVTRSDATLSPDDAELLRSALNEVRGGAPDDGDEAGSA